MSIKGLTELEAKEPKKPTSLMLLTTCRALRHITGAPFLHLAEVVMPAIRHIYILDVLGYMDISSSLYAFSYFY